MKSKYEIGDLIEITDLENNTKSYHFIKMIEKDSLCHVPIKERIPITGSYCDNYHNGTCSGYGYGLFPDHFYHCLERSVSDPYYFYSVKKIKGEKK